MTTRHHIVSHTKIAAIFAAIAFLTASCSRPPQWRVTEGVIWNTTYRVVYQSVVNLDDSITDVMHNVEKSLSPFNPQSVISRINRNETDLTDAIIDSVFAISQHVSARTGGRFDPTVSPLVNLWGFGYDKSSRKRAEADSDPSAQAALFAVSQEEIDSALAMVGINKCHISNGKIVKKHPATTFNFSAVTKGFACDMVAAMLQRNGASNNLVEIGGEITAMGHNRDGMPWRIQIDAPVESADVAIHNALTTISVSSCGVASSGNYRNFHDTHKYGRIGHTIDPVTGFPARTNVVAATIVAPNAAIADAWATACMASWANEALNNVRQENGVECMLVVTHNDTIKCVTSEGFPTNE